MWHADFQSRNPHRSSEFVAKDVFLDWTVEKHRFRSWKMWIWDHMRTEEERYLVAPLKEETPLPVFTTLRFVETGGIPQSISKREIQRPILGRSLTSWLAMGSGASVAAAGGVNWCHIWFLLTVFWVKWSETRPKMACLMISGISIISRNHAVSSKYWKGVMP